MTENKERGDKECEKKRKEERRELERNKRRR